MDTDENSFQKRTYLGSGIFENDDTLPDVDVETYVGDYIAYMNKQGKFPTRGELVEELGIPRTTIFDAIDRIATKRKAKVKKIKFKKNQRGRDFVGYKLKWLER